MTKERVTRDDLRSMRVGQTMIFELPNANVCESARVQAAQLAAEDLAFKVTKDGCIVSITRTK